MLASTLATLTVGGALACQTMTARKAADAAKAVAAVLQDDPVEGASKQAVKALEDLIDALGNAAEREVATLVLDVVKESGDDMLILKTATAGTLLDAVKKHRVRGYPDRLLPALLLLESRDPEDPRVLFALAEARAIASLAFDAVAAEKGFARLLEVLREGSGTGGDAAARLALLTEFLPELAVTPMLSKREQGEATFWLRQQLLVFRDTLQKGEAIALGQLAEPRLLALQELLLDARRTMNQPRCKKVLDAMLLMQPTSPALHYALFEVHASMGSAYDRQLAIKHLEEFLVRTDPEVVESTRGEMLGAMPLQHVQRDLLRYRPARPEGRLDLQRTKAIEWSEVLDDKKAKPMFLSPNRSHVEKHRRKLVRESNRPRKRKRELEDKIARNERNLARVRVAKVNSGDKATRINAFLRAIGDQKSKLRGYTKLLAPYEVVLKEIDQLLAAAKQPKKSKR